MQIRQKVIVKTTWQHLDACHSGRSTRRAASRIKSCVSKRIRAKERREVKQVVLDGLFREDEEQTMPASFRDEQAEREAEEALCREAEEALAEMYSTISETPRKVRVLA